MSDDEIFSSYFLNIIMKTFKIDYPYIQELLEYKRDGTLAFLKSTGAIAFYQGSLDLDVKKDIKSWQDFIEFSKEYIKQLVTEGLQKYQSEEKFFKKQKLSKLDMGILEPFIITISISINDEHLRRFPKWPESGTQGDYIKICIKNSLDKNYIRLYSIWRGTIFVKDTRLDHPKNDCRFRVEFLGRPEFHLIYFDLLKIRQNNEMAKINNSAIRKCIDKLEEKIIEKGIN